MNSSEQLADQVHTAIASSPYLSGRQLRFEASEGKIVLSGKVATYYQKQMAQEALRRIEGVEKIENQLEVCWA